MLKSQAVIMANRLADKYTSKDDRLVLFYSGMSGVASATALSIVMDDDHNFPVITAMVYVRKLGEVSHGIHIESSIINTIEPAHRLVPIFVDDFVCNGTTFKYVKREVAKYVRDNTVLFYDYNANSIKFFDKLSRARNWMIAEVDRGSLKSPDKALEDA
jgi:hypothetical protein